MRAYLKIAIGIVGGIVVAAAPVFAAGRGNGNGNGGGGENQAGGLPALEDRVDCLNAALGATSWAVVTAGGTVNRSQPPTGVTVEHASTGVYEVTFPTDVHDCAYQATIGDTDSVAPTQAEISVSGDTDGDNPNDVYVQTFAVGTSTPANAPFHLLVTCPVTSCP